MDVIGGGVGRRRYATWKSVVTAHTTCQGSKRLHNDFAPKFNFDPTGIPRMSLMQSTNY
jgi:hypothetical protein